MELCMQCGLQNTSWKIQFDFGNRLSVPIYVCHKDLDSQLEMMVKPGESEKFVIENIGK